MTDVSSEKFEVQQQSVEEESQPGPMGDAGGNLRRLPATGVEPMDTPFSWKPVMDELLLPEQNVKRLLEKRATYDGRPDCLWRIVVLDVALCYEYDKNMDDRETALDMLDHCETLMESYNGDAEDLLFAHYSAFCRVIDSTRCYVTPDVEERDRLLARLRPAEALTQSEEATILGIRATLLMEYGYEGNNLAGTYLSTAVRLDPEVAQWHFLYGQCLGRLRHMKYSGELPLDLELVSLERAVELSPNPYFLAYLGQACREAASSFARQATPDESQRASNRQVCDKLNRRAVQLYDRVSLMCPDCPYINVRCAQGFLRFDRPHRDLKRAYQHCQKAVELAPCNVMISHVWGQINYRMKNYDTASKSLQFAAGQGAFGPSMDLLRLRMSLDTRYNPIPFLEEMLEKDLACIFDMKINLMLGEYYYTVKRNVHMAAEYILKKFYGNPNSKKMLEYKTFFDQSPKCLNLYVILLEAAARLSEDARNAKFRKLIWFCEMKYPSLVEEVFSRPAPTDDRRRTENWRRKDVDDGVRKAEGTRSSWRDQDRGQRNRVSRQENWRHRNGDDLGGETSLPSVAAPEEAVWTGD